MSALKERVHRKLSSRHSSTNSNFESKYVKHLTRLRLPEHLKHYFNEEVYKAEYQEDISIELTRTCSTSTSLFGGRTASQISQISHIQGGSKTSSINTTVEVGGFLSAGHHSSHSNHHHNISNSVHPVHPVQHVSSSVSHQSNSTSTAAVTNHLTNVHKSSINNDNLHHNHHQHHQSSSVQSNSINNQLNNSSAINSNYNNVPEINIQNCAEEIKEEINAHSDDGSHEHTHSHSHENQTDTTYSNTHSANDNDRHRTISKGPESHETDVTDHSDTQGKQNLDEAGQHEAHVHAETKLNAIKEDHKNLIQDLHDSQIMDVVVGPAGDGVIDTGTTRTSDGNWGGLDSNLSSIRVSSDMTHSRLPTNPPPHQVTDATASFPWFRKLRASRRRSDGPNAPTHTKHLHLPLTETKSSVLPSINDLNIDDSDLQQLSLMCFIHPKSGGSGGRVTEFCLN